jgi:HlyD family secretion protein
MKKIVAIIALTLLIGAGVVFRTQVAAFGEQAIATVSQRLSPEVSQESVAGAPLAASGTIEAESISIGPTAGGRIAALHVTEGDKVAAGDLIAEMDTALLDIQMEKAQAARALAQAQLAMLEAGAPDTDLAVARAAVVQAEAALGASRVASQDAQALISAPGELDVAIAEAKARVQAAEEQVTAAQAGATAADLEQALRGRIVKSLQEGFAVGLPMPGSGSIHVDAPSEKLAAANLEWNLSSQRTWEAHAKVDAAFAARDAARQALADLRAQRADPLQLQSQADAAGAAARVAEAAAVKSQADLNLLKAGAPREQIEAARAVVDGAKGALEAIEVRRGQAQVTAPRAGTVTAVVSRGGEVIGSGTPIIRLADLGNVTLTVYVPEPQLGLVQLGTSAQVIVDSFPGQTFRGTVTHIADQAEFTPKNVQTREERANTVYAVKINLPNPGGALKPGMPADAYFCGPDSAGCLPIAAEPAAAPGTTGSETIEASGAIEGVETVVGAELGGRVVRVDTAEGDQVKAGQVMAQIDDSELVAQLTQAQAALATAKADMARVTAQPQDERVAQAQAQVGQAEAALDGARTALENGVKLRKNPQDLDARIDNAQAQVRTATTGIDLARAQLKPAQVLQASLPGPTSDEDRTRRAMYDQQVIAAEAAVRVAQAQEQGARAVLAQLQAIRRNPVALEATVHRAEGQVAQAEAALEVAKAVLAQVQAAAQPEAFAVAQAKVAQAEAESALLQATKDKLTVRSPATGTVTVQAIHTGEVAQPGQPLFTVVDLEDLRLVIYVPAGRVGEVRLGQQAEVSVDAYPGRTFTGTVTHIADQAEFTPKNVQTAEERVKTVFAIEIGLDNGEGLLKPGMPADARLKPAAGSP